MADAVDLALQVLNEALDADPEAINLLFAHEVPINDDLVPHWSIQVGESLQSPDSGYVLRVMGLINGLFGVASDDYGYIGMDVADDGRINRFIRIREANE